MSTQQRASARSERKSAEGAAVERAVLERGKCRSVPSSHHWLAGSRCGWSPFTMCPQNRRSLELEGGKAGRKEAGRGSRREPNAAEGRGQAAEAASSSQQPAQQQRRPSSRRPTCAGRAGGGSAAPSGRSCRRRPALALVWGWRGIEPVSRVLALALASQAAACPAGGRTQQAPQASNQVSKCRLSSLPHLEHVSDQGVGGCQPHHLERLVADVEVVLCRKKRGVGDWPSIQSVRFASQPPPSCCHSPRQASERQQAPAPPVMWPTTTRSRVSTASARTCTEEGRQAQTLICQPASRRRPSMGEPQ